MDDKNKENEIIDASSSPLFQLANETKEEEQQINNDFLAKKEVETTITNSEVNQMFNKGTVASPDNNSSNTFTNDVINNEVDLQNTYTNTEENKVTLEQNVEENVPVQTQPTNNSNNNNESNPMIGIILLVILFLGIGGISYYNMFLKDSSDTKKSSSNVTEKKEDTEKEEVKEEPKQEEIQSEQPKQGEPVKEVTNTVNCSGTTTDYGITIKIDATIVYKNQELYTVKVVEKSNDLNKEIIDQVAKIAYVGGYSYSTTSDYKTITMTGTKNTLAKSVKDELGTMDKAKSYYTKMGLRCSIK